MTDEQQQKDTGEIITYEICGHIHIYIHIAIPFLVRGRATNITLKKQKLDRKQRVLQTSNLNHVVCHCDPPPLPPLPSNTPFLPCSLHQEHCCDILANAYWSGSGKARTPCAPRSGVRCGKRGKERKKINNLNKLKVLYTRLRGVCRVGEFLVRLFV